MFKVLLLNILLSFHSIHVTLTTVSQDEGSDTLHVFFRMYLDDFQLDLKQFYPEFKPGKDNDTTNFSNEMLNRYFNEKVRIYMNDKLLTGNLTKVSINSYEILLYLDYHSIKNPRNFKIRNTILTSIYNDQANMVYLNIHSFEEAIKLTADDKEKKVKIK
jgi:hypothetical protein